MITISEIERAIEDATAQTDRFCGSGKKYIEIIILPLLDILEAGICAGLECDSESIRLRMDSLEGALKRKFNL